MRTVQRLGAALLTLALLISMAPVALADSVSQSGEFIRATDSLVYLSLSDGSKDVLYSMNADGTNMTVLETYDTVSSIVRSGDDVYYLRLDGALFQVVHRSATDDGTVIAEFTADDVVSSLSMYDGLLYCIVNNALTTIDPATGTVATLGENKMSEYVIVEDVVFFAASDVTRTYERLVTTTNETLSQTGGTLWSMSITGENAEQALDVGVADLKAYGDSLYFHNLEDNYPMGSTDDMWLEGKLYRYNIAAGQTTSMGLDYDWDFYPTAYGVVVYTSMDVSLYPLTGGAKTQLMTPELRAGLTAYDATAYVYEYTDRKLTALPLDGGEPVLLYNNGDVVDAQGTVVDPFDIVDDTDGEPIDATIDDNAVTDDDTSTDETVMDDENTTGDTTTSTATGSGYIFPNSSKKKLTRSQVLAISKSKWCYARNEIFARHGYKFKKSKYANYFAKKSWYKPGGFSRANLNSIEWYNMDLIKNLEIEYGLLDGTPTKTDDTSTSSSAKNNYYIFPNSSRKKLTEKQILAVSKSKWGYARNEIYARHGYKFKTAKYRKYFKNQKWYKEGGFSTKKLNSVEWYNMKLIKKMEKKYGVD